MRTVRIDGADPKPLGAPRDWDPDTHGHCAALFIRNDTEDGLNFMRSAWEAEHHEAMLMLIGGKAILGISGRSHPVVNMGVAQVPADFEPIYTCRRTIMNDGSPGVRVDVLYPISGWVRIFCTVPSQHHSFSEASAYCIERCDAVALEQGWLPNPKGTGNGST